MLDIITLVLTTLEIIIIVGSLLVAIKQLRDSKEISRASFIIELNRSYVENVDYADVYSKLQDCVDEKCPWSEPEGCRFYNRKECKQAFEKGVISNYLTFFETIYLLQKNGAISFKILNDLFGYRFFLAVHSKAFQQAKLKKVPENFKNIYCLENEWLTFRAKSGRREGMVTSSFRLNTIVDENRYIALVHGSPAHIKMAKSAFQFRRCTAEDFDDIKRLNDSALAELTDPEILRNNSPEMLKECLQSPHLCLGAFHDDELVAFAMLYYPQDPDEELAAELDGVDVKDKIAVNNKLCIVSKEYRGNGLQLELSKQLEEQANIGGAQIICATVSPKNSYSIANIEHLGYQLNKTSIKYGLARNIYYKFL